MSTILEALKKSENSRKLNDIPTLSSSNALDEKTSHVSLIWIILFIIGTLSVFAAIYAYQNKDDSSQVENSPPKAIQSLIINAISFSKNREKRVIMINGDLYREGDSITPELKVEKISHYGVVIDYQGDDHKILLK